MGITESAPGGAGASVTETFTTDTGLFARQSTGLVRNVSGKQAIVMNIIAGMPALGVVVAVFFGLSGFPKGNFYLALLLTLPLSLAVSYAFGLQSAIIPRSGGDYMIVSRIVHPAIGLVSTSCMMLAQLMAIGSLGLFTVTLALVPGLQTISLVAHSHTLWSWASTLSSSKGWQFGLAAATILVVGSIVSIGWKWARRFIIWGFAIGVAGLVVAMGIALFTSHGTFVSSFNSFALRFTHQPDTYHSIVAAGKAKGAFGSGFSMSQTFALIGVMATFGFYAWNSAFIAGEVREGSTLKTAHRMGLGAFWSLAIVALAILIFFHAWGHDFLASAFGGAFPSQLGSSPAYFMLTSAEVGSTPFAVLMVASFMVVFPVVFAVIIVVMSRVVFAWAFDGVFPKAVTKVNRNNSPYVASGCLIGGAILVLIWQVFIATSLIQIYAYLSLIQFAAVALVGLAAVVLPYRRPDLFRSSVSTIRVAGIPLVSIVGVGTLLATGIVYYLYFKYPYFGVRGHAGAFLAWLGGTVLVGFLFYGIARWVRARQGVNLDLVYAEIPPE
jgi:basic amino acid/polyamine antiporter, APA family